MTDSTLRIIEDTLLAAHDQDPDGFVHLEASTLIDLASRMFVLTGFDRETIGGYAWVPEGLEAHFTLNVAKRYDGATS